MYASVERVTRYQYDGAGNITGLSFQQQSDVPIITSLNPNFINVGRTRSAIASGNNLLGADVLTDNPNLSVSNINASIDQVTFDITSNELATEGSAILRFVTALGEVPVDFFIAETPPVLNSLPSPIIIADDSEITIITLEFDEPRPQSETYTVNIPDSSIATSSLSTFTIAAGQRQTSVSLTGVSKGVTSLNIELLDQFAFYSFPVTVAKDFSELLEEYPDIRQRSVFGDRVGVVVQSSVVAASNTFSKPVGVIRDVNVLESSSDDSIFSPAVAITIASEIISPNGLAYSRAVGVTINTAPETVSLNRLSYSEPVGIRIDANNIINIDTAFSQAIEVVIGPVLDGVQPSTTSSDVEIILQISGMNLQEIQAVSLSPNEGITVGTLSTNQGANILFVPLMIDSEVSTGSYQITLSDEQGPIDTRSGLPLTLTIE